MHPVMIQRSSKLFYQNEETELVGCEAILLGY
jgi:hypothetical protein